MTDDELRPGLLALARALGRYQASVDIRRGRDDPPGRDGDAQDARPQAKADPDAQAIDSHESLSWLE